jgi:hypothetical protein
MNPEPEGPMTGYEAYRCLLQLYARPENIDLAKGLGPLAEFLGMTRPKGREALTKMLENPRLTPEKLLLWGLAEASLHQALTLEDFTQHALALSETFRRAVDLPGTWQSLARIARRPTF